MDEIRLAFRRLLKRPTVSFAGVLVLAVGIGSAAATWSLLSSVLLKPLPVKEPDQLQLLGEVRTESAQPAIISNTFIYPFYPLIRDSGVFERIGAQWGPIPLEVTANGAPTQRVGAVRNTRFFFRS